MTRLRLDVDLANRAAVRDLAKRFGRVFQPGVKILIAGGVRIAGNSMYQDDSTDL